MIAEDAEQAMLRTDMGHEAAQMTEAGSDGSVGLHPDIAANQAEIDLNILQVMDKGIGQAIESVQVEIGQQEDAKLVKGVGQRGEAECFFHHLYLEGIDFAFFIEACHLEDCGEKDHIREEAGQIEEGLPSGQRCMAVSYTHL